MSRFTFFFLISIARALLPILAVSNQTPPQVEETSSSSPGERLLGGSCRGWRVSGGLASGLREDAAGTLRWQRGGGSRRRCNSSAPSSPRGARGREPRRGQVGVAPDDSIDAALNCHPHPAFSAAAVMTSGFPPTVMTMGSIFAELSRVQERSGDEFQGGELNSAIRKVHSERKGRDVRALTARNHPKGQFYLMERKRT